MLVDAKCSALKEAYRSMSEGISNIESFLPKVENEDMNYDLNRQLNDYQRLANLCKDELLKLGETLDENVDTRRIQQSDGSFTYRSDVECSGKEYNTDEIIAQSVVDDIRRRIDNVRLSANNSSSDAVSGITMEIMEEEENHMDWMKSYVK